MKTQSPLSSFLVYLEILLLIFGQFGRITIFNGVSFYLLELVILVHTLVILYSHQWINFLRHKDLLTRLNKAQFIGILWLSTCLLFVLVQSYQYSLPENIRAVSYQIRLANFALFAVVLGKYAGYKTVANAVNFLSIVLPITALVQYFLWPDLRFLQAYGWDPHMYRAVGMIFDPPIIGSVLGMLLVYRITKPPGWLKSYSSLSVFLLTTTIVLLYSRSTYLAVFLAVNTCLLTQKKLRLNIIWNIVFLLGVYLAPLSIPKYFQIESAKILRSSTVTSRQTEIIEGLRSFSKNIVWGIGYNRVREYKEKLAVNSEQETGSKNNSISPVKSINPSNHAGSAYHSFWVTQAATTGVLGLSLLLWFFATTIRKKPTFLPIIFVPSFIGLFDNTLFHPFVLLSLIFIYVQTSPVVET